jgi:hypothetical protein
MTTSPSSPVEAEHLYPRKLCGIPVDAWELVDAALWEALLAGQVTADELHELAGWLDDDDDYGND